MDELFDKAFAIVLRDKRINYADLQHELNILGHRALSLNHAIITKLVQSYKANRTEATVPKPVNLPLNCTFEMLAERAVKNARPHKTANSPLWVAMLDTFAVGSTTAHELCRCYDLDPDKIVSGARCISCNP